jgi:hypothetical protein
MNHPTASSGVLFLILSRHSVLGTEFRQVFWIPAAVYPGYLSRMQRLFQSSILRVLTKEKPVLDKNDINIQLEHEESGPVRV